MKFLGPLLTAVLSIGSINAAPAVESNSAVEERGTLTSRTLPFLTTQYKLKAYCPDHPEVHNKCLNKHPSNGNLGFWGTPDYQFYLDNGFWGGSSWGGHPSGQPSWDMCMVGPQGWKQLGPWNAPGKNDPWKDHGGGGYGAPPAKWGSWGNLWIDPLPSLLEQLDVLGLFTRKHHLRWMWYKNDDAGYDWICYKDPAGKGWNVQHWDHKYPLDKDIINNYFILQIEVAKA